jgi:hypothetical protein
MRATCSLAILTATLMVYGCDESPEVSPLDAAADAGVDSAGSGSDTSVQHDAGTQEDAPSIRDAIVEDAPPPAVQTGKWMLLEGPQPYAFGASVTGLRGSGEEGYGRVLIAGGYAWMPKSTEGNIQRRAYTKEAWIYDMASRTFERAGTMNVARAGHTATQLPDGRVLLAGGEWDVNKYLASTEIFDPAKPPEEAWVPGPPLIGGPRGGHAAVLLDDGRVIVMGSYLGGFEDTVEAFSIPDPVNEPNGRWESIAAPLNEKRSNPVAVLLEAGKLMVVGGSWGKSQVDTVEIFDPSQGAFQILGASEDPDDQGQRLSVPKTAPALVPYRDRTGKERVLVVGGGAADGAKDEIIDPAFEVIRPINHPFGAPTGHAASLLNDGRVIVCGGSQYSTFRWLAFVFDPRSVSPTWNTMPNMRIGREDHQAVTMRDGTVLVVGGSTSGDAIVDRAELFVPGETPLVEPQAPSVSWQKLEGLDDSSDRESIWGTSADDLWVADEDGVVHHWNGTAWTEHDLPSYGDDVVDIHGAGPDHVYVLGERSRVWHYDGDEWTVLRTADRSSAHAIRIIGQKLYIGVGPDILVHTLGDEAVGEPVWTESYVSPDASQSYGRNIMDIWAGAQGTFAAGANGVVLELVGEQWEARPFVSLAEISAVSGNENGVYFVGDRSALAVRWTADGYQALDSRDFDDINAVSATEGKAIAVGVDGTVLYHDGSAPFWQSLGGSLPEETRTAELDDVWASGDDVVVIGYRGRVYKGTLQAEQ